ncbi:hypothetical protein LFM09_45585 [Lentzea alba]|uniref:hypothetical protein n=1 Tax=Lentzea alba TaxID=2714351 RepID=UPI0039BFA5AE
MRDVLDDDLAELYTVRSADDVRLARLREQLFAEPPAKRSRRWVGIAAAAAAVVMITGLVVTLRPASRDAPATLPTKPATSLQEAATLLEIGPKPTGRYQHITYRIWQVLPSTAFGLSEIGTLQVEFEYNAWVPTAPGEMVVVYRRETGQRRPMSGAQPAPDKSVGQLSLPRLWTTFCAATPCKEESLSTPLPADPKQKLAAAAHALLSPFTTNEERAALYRRLAESPEIRWDNGKVSAEGGRFLFTVDPATGRVSGMEEADVAGVTLVNGTRPTSVTVTYEWTDQRPS